MTGNLSEVLIALLETALAGLLAGDAPAVTLSIVNESFQLDPQSAEAEAGMPRPDDRLEQFDYDPAAPPESLSLSRAPYPGPRRVCFTSDVGDKITLSVDEVVWSEEDSRMFSLQPKAMRNLSEVTGVEVLYSVTSVFTKLKAIQSLSLQLQLNSEDETQLEAAEALSIGFIELNRQTLIDNANALYEEGDYGAAISIKSLKCLGGEAQGDSERQLNYQAEIELKASRALRENEGQPIEYILTPGQTPNQEYPIDVDIEVNA